MLRWRHVGCAPAVRAGRVVRAELKVQRRDAEPRRELPQRLLRWDTLPGLEAAEVGVGEAGLGQLALREAALLAQAPDADADRLGTFGGHVVRVDAERRATRPPAASLSNRREAVPGRSSDGQRFSREPAM